MFSRHSTRKLVTAPRVVLASAVIFAAVPTYFAQSASAGVAAVPANFTSVVTDANNANDVVGQGDLTQMGRDDSDATYLKIFWSWDDATLNGGNTLDACALLDVNGNGKIDAAVCGSAIAGAGVTVLQNGAPTVSTCDDAWTDRCGQPAVKAQAAGDITSGALGATTPPAPSPPADLVTGTDPFAAGSDAPKDTTLEVHVKKAYLPSAALVNVCSYPSGGAGGINTDPKDCIVNPGGGAVQVTKTVAGTPPAGLNPFLIDLTCGKTTTQLSLTQATVGSTSTAAMPVLAGTTCSVDETAAHAQGATVSYSGAQTAAAGTFNVAPGVTSAVTVTNTFTPPPGSVQVKKAVAGSPPAGLKSFDIDVTCAGAKTTYTFTQTTVGTSAAQPTPAQSEPAGTSCSVDETAANAQGAAVTYSGAQTTAGGTFNIVTGQTSIVTVTNTFTPIVIIPPPPPGSPALGVTKSSVPASGSFVKPGDSVVYTLAYNNTGSAVATGVTLTDALPADLDYVTGTATAPGQYDTATRTLSWALGNLPVGANGTVSFTAKVANTATNGEVLHNVGVINAPGISDPSNADDVTVTVPTGALTLTKNVSKTSAEYGDNLVYTLNAAATGQITQTNVKVTDTVPTGTTYVDNSASCASPCTASEAAGVVTWTVGTLAAGSSMNLTFQVTVDKPAAAADGSLPAETIDNSGVAGSDQDPSVQSNQVSTGVVEVLGVKVTRKPTVKGEKQTRLPFTGMPFPLWQVLGVSLAMVMLGSALSFGMRQPRPAEEPRWRDV